MPSEPIYRLRPQQVFQSLETSPDGLDSAEARSRLSLYGENALSEEQKEPLGYKILKHTLHPQAGILLLATLLAFLGGDPGLSLVILALIVFNAIFSYWREYRAEQAIEKLKAILPAYAHVLRDGQEAHILAKEVVPGDVLILAEGDHVPADARVVEEFGLRVNNSTLTGESVPARKIADASYQQEISELEQPNLIFAGTSVTAGTGRAVVYATSMLTQFGRIAHLTQSIADPPSPMQKELRQVTKIITLTALAIGLLILVVGFTSGLGLSSSALLFFTLGIIVAVIPEGLPATLTLSLAIAAQRLTQKGVLAKKLNTIETLGTVSVICTDKSGTLTQNQMTVREIWVSRRKIKVSGVGYEPKGKFSPEPNGHPWGETFLALLEAADCCNNARLNPPNAERPTWTSLGDQTEAAMKVAALKAKINEKELGLVYPRVHEIPFDARRKRMTTIHRGLHSEVAFTKGAPREVLQLCTHVEIDNEVLPLDDALRAEILAANDDYARRALRVLAVARRELVPGEESYRAENIEHNLVFLGLMAMMDPPRPEVETAIKTCRQAGIRIIMITGDYGLTAESLARRVGMLTTHNARIITGAELDTLSDIELRKALAGEVLFARMAPEHKMRIVMALQSLGEVVAVTGDGVNDAPALRKADVGVAMGLVGTDVAKEAADIILANDNFGAIVHAIEEGRAIYDNVRKFITYIFSSNVPEVMPFLVTASYPLIPLALNVRQILAIDLGTDLLPAVALGTEKPEPNVMEHPPRKRNTPLVDGGLLARSFLWLGLIEAALCFSGFFAVYLFSGNLAVLLPNVEDVTLLAFLTELNYPAFLHLDIPPEDVGKMATTVFHAGVVMAQVGNAFACRSGTLRNTRLGWGSNRFLLIAALLEIVSIVAIIYIEPIAGYFNHVDIPLRYWAGLALFPFILYALEWIRKQLVRRMETRKTDSFTPMKEVT
ncbi:MAG: cation-transporting P-type ATPase [Anaerolineales bacterium]